jgi:integrase
VRNGTIYKRGEKWYVNATVAGTRVRQSAGSTRLEALRLLDSLQRTEGDPFDGATMHEVMDAFTKSLVLRKMKSSYIQKAVRHQTMFTEFYGPSFDATKLVSADIERFVAHQLDAGFKRSSVKQSLRMLRAALGRAVDDGLLKELPLTAGRWRATVPKVPMLEPRVLMPFEVDRLLGVAAPPYDVVMLIALRAGLRHQEILHLQVRDADFVQMHLTVSPKPEVGWSPKSQHERVVPLSPRLATVLEKHIAGLADRGPRAWVFVGPEGRRRYVWEPVKAIFEAAGLYDPEARPGLHMLRRTWATQCLAGGASIADIMKMAGWASLAVAQRYIASTDAGKRAAIAALDGE